MPGPDCLLKFAPKLRPTHWRTLTTGVPCSRPAHPGTTSAIVNSCKFHARSPLAHFPGPLPLPRLLLSTLLSKSLLPPRQCTMENLRGAVPLHIFINWRRRTRFSGFHRWGSYLPAQFPPDQSAVNPHPAVQCPKSPTHRSPVYIYSACSPMAPATFRVPPRPPSLALGVPLPQTPQARRTKLRPVLPRSADVSSIADRYSARPYASSIKTIVLVGSLPSSTASSLSLGSATAVRSATAERVAQPLPLAHPHLFIQSLPFSLLPPVSVSPTATPSLSRCHPHPTESTMDTNTMSTLISTLAFGQALLYGRQHLACSQITTRSCAEARNRRALGARPQA